MPSATVVKTVVSIPTIKQLMQSHRECLPCFLGQALRTMRMLSLDESTQDRVMQACLGLLLGVGQGTSPLYIAGKIQQIVHENSDTDDAYLLKKQAANESVSAALPYLLAAICETEIDPFEQRLRTSIVGNLIDNGIYEDTSLARLQSQLVDARFTPSSMLQQLKQTLEQAETLTLILDNAGEIVLDRAWLQWVMETFQIKRALVAVRSQPFFNDALLEDAHQCGFTALRGVEVLPFWPISSTQDSQSKSTWERLRQSDIVIAKGQANFEALSEQPDIFFHFVIKCPHVATYMQERSGQPAEVGQFVCWKS